ncbi:MAG: hypothetical protein WCT04_28180, partial [Planctomycetota bacterium]
RVAEKPPFRENLLHVRTFTRAEPTLNVGELCDGIFRDFATRRSAPWRGVCTYIKPQQEAENSQDEDENCEP